MNKKKPLVLIIGAGMIILGAIIILIAFAANDFSFKKLTGNDEYVKYEKTLELDDCGELLVDLNTEDIDIGVSSDDKVHITYYDNKNITHTLKQEDGVISLSSKSEKKGWRRFLYINISLNDRNDEILLPKDFAGKISVEVTTGDVHINGLSGIKNAEVSVTTGDVTFENITADSGKFKATTGDITLGSCEFAQGASAKATTGKIKLTGVSASDNISVITTTGKIYCSKLECAEFSSDCTTGKVSLDTVKTNKINVDSNTGDVRLSDIDSASTEISTDTGDIKGSLYGEEKLYSIECDTNTGDCNLRSILRENARGLKLSTTTGDIDIDFSEE